MARRKKESDLTSTRLPADYPAFLESLKSRVLHAQTKAMLSVNRELIQLYWDIGRLIVERQELEGWGKGIVDRLGADVQKAFPGLGGFSPANVWRMRALYVAYRPDPTILSQAATELSRKESARTVSKSTARKVAQPVRELPADSLPDVIAGIPWGHNVVLIQKVKNAAQRIWYASKTVEHGWSRAVLAVRDIAKPIGVAEWQTKLVQSLPEPLKGNLPSIEEIEAEFGSDELP